MDGQLPFPSPDESASDEPSDSTRETTPPDLAGRELSIETRAVGIVGVEQARMALQAGIAAKTRVRRRCQRCNSDIATVTPNGPHLAATCATCGVFIYNAPRHEFGLATRPVSENRKEIRPKRRAAILARDNGRCVLCGRAAADGVALTIGHLLSVDEGVALGADRDLLNDDLNLAAMCDTCQLGLGRQSVPVVVYLGLLLLYAERARRDGQPLEQIDITVPSYKAGRPTGGA